MGDEVTGETTADDAAGMDAAAAAAIGALGGEAHGQWLNTPGGPHPGTARSVLSAASGSRHDLDLVAAESGGVLSRSATAWAQSLLEVARFELARADDKANTMFRFYGVVAAISIGMLVGHSWSPADLNGFMPAVFWAGCAAFGLSGWFLGSTLYPRNIRRSPKNRLLYFGNVIEYDSPAALEQALAAIDDYEGRLVEQLFGISRLVHHKYSLMRGALISLGAGAALTIGAVIVSALIG